MNVNIQNKEARFNYEILDEFEAGLVLAGDEIKAIRSGRVNLKGSYAKIFFEKEKPSVFLVGAHFHTQTIDPYRTKKLLLHSKEIKHLVGKIQEKGLTLIPLSIYMTRGIAKIKLALGRGKKTHDKRAILREKEINRTIQRAVRGK